MRIHPALMASALLACILFVGGGGALRAAGQAGGTAYGGMNFDIPNPEEGGHGGRVYLESCAGCHDTGVDRAPQRIAFSYMSPQSMYRALTSGAMKAQAEHLSDADKIAVSEFLTRRKIGSAETSAEPPMCKGTKNRFDFTDPPALSGWGLSPGNTRAVSAKQAGLNKGNVGQLRLKWAVALPNAVQVRSQPALAGGALFVGSHNGQVYALDRETGCARWIFQAGAEVRTGISVSPWRAGDRKAQPFVYFGDFSGNIYALNALSGDLVWRVRADDHANATITGAPTLFENSLYVPVSSLEGVRAADPAFECCSFRGSVVALDAETGDVRWKTYMTGPPREMGVNSHGTTRYGPSGAPIWSSPSIDVKRRQLYVGTGQNYSSPASGMSNAIVAIGLDKGTIKWAFQGLSGDATNLACNSADKANCPVEKGPDFDMGAGAMLVTGTDGDAVIGGQKSGMVHAINPDNGKLIWQNRVGRGGKLGGIHLGMAAGKDMLFVPVNDAFDGQTYVEPARPGVYALDKKSGAVKWAAPADKSGCADPLRCKAGYSQAITAGGDVVFAGSADGHMRAFDADTGALLWQVDSTMPVRDVNGREARGGAFSGGAGPVVSEGMLFISSGYSIAGMKAGNVLMAFEAP